MTELEFQTGDTIFHEGDASSSVCLIRRGTVDVFKRIDDDVVRLGSVGEGEFVGEMGVIEKRPRGATVRAATDVALEMLSEEEFLLRLSEDAATAMRALRRLSERLRAANDRVLEVETSGTRPAGEAAPDPAGPVVRLLADHPRVGREVPKEGLAVEQLPFHVGRPSGRGERPAAVELSLALRDGIPYRLSRVHFSLIADGDGVAVRDVGSTLGTLVNGELIGEHAPRVFARLQEGENRVQAGGVDSPFAFRIVVGAP